MKRCRLLMLLSGGDSAKLALVISQEKKKTQDLIDIE